jgi:TonB family protein
MRAPVPVRRLARSEGRVPAGRVQLAALIGRDGRVADVQVLRAGNPDASRGAITDFEHWEFRPATRNGVPVDVDVIVEIAYR